MRERAITIKNSKYFIGISLGVVIAVGSSFLLFQSQAQKEMRPIWELKNSVGMYEVISSDNLKQVQIPAKSFSSDMITDRSKIIGKISKGQISAETPLLNSNLDDKSILANQEFVVLKTDYARSGGAKVGDKVSICKIDKTKGAWVSGTDGSLVIDNATVVSISDANGKSVTDQKQSSSNPLASQASLKIQAVRLAVQKGTSTHITDAAVMEDNGYVLVVKGD